MQHATYPELRVDGEPFFVHGATFEYYGIPQDLWGTSLDRFSDLGINTIFLSIPWNWHEPREGEFDFDGHSNPRRNLRGLLRFIAERRLKLVIRPGPTIGRADGSRWHLGGYPEWLLARPEYKIESSARQAGDYPPLAKLGEKDAEAAALGWLESPAHMSAVQKWLASVARELSPYLATRTLRVPDPSAKVGQPEEAEINGPLLWIQLDSSPGFADEVKSSESFWQYMGELRSILRTNGLDALVTINLAAANWASIGSSPPDPPFAFTGHWFLSPLSAGEGTSPQAPRMVTAHDEAQLLLLASALAEQPQFPPIVADFQAGWHPPEDDWRPLEVSPENTLLASRLLLAHGVTGIVYSPLQDSLAPAGWEAPGTHWYNRWEAALNVAGNLQPKARGVERNSQLIKHTGALLAASHMRADFGLLDLRSSLPAGATAEDFSAMKKTLDQVQRVGALAGLEGAWLDPARQPVEQLLRHAVLLLPAPTRGLAISEMAQRAIVEYVHRGGTLISFPSRPTGQILAELLSRATTQNQATHAPSEHTVGPGRVIEWTKDFYSWVMLGDSDAQNRARFEAAWATQSFRGILDRVGMRPVARRSGFELQVTQRVANAGTGTLGARMATCGQESFCGQGLLSVTNRSDAPVEETLEVLSPRVSEKARGNGYLPLTVVVPAHESLLLPLRLPLCSAAPATRTCRDEVTVAGAELLHAERDGKTLEITFYAPARATVRLRLEKMPARLRVDDANLEGRWTPAEQMLEVTLPRGASPHFLRVLRLRLPYTPYVPEKSDPARNRRRDFAFTVADAVRLPLGPDVSLSSYPPLILLNAEQSGQLLARADNFDEMGREIHLRLQGSVRGSERMILDGKEILHENMKVSADQQANAGGNGPPENGDGLLHGVLEVRSGAEGRTVPIVFASVGEGIPTLYTLDFDRDGAPEWVLENERLRLILQPELGGSALALVDKTVGTNLITTLGALRDSLVSPAGTVTPVRTYRPQKSDGPNEPVVRMRSMAIQDADGITVEKTIRVVTANAIEVDYRTHAPSPQASSISHLEILSSMPALVSKDSGTRFCWTDGETPQPRCVDFQRAGSPIQVPLSVLRLEVRTPGSPGLSVEWKQGAIRVEMKEFSALLRLALPATPESTQVRYTILPPD